MPMKKCDYNGQYERLEIVILEHRKWKKWWLKKKMEATYPHKTQKQS
jgi:hypothetical protein